jgi:hypothetical protein
MSEIVRVTKLRVQIANLIEGNDLKQESIIHKLEIIFFTSSIVKRAAKHLTLEQM